MELANGSIVRKDSSVRSSSSGPTRERERDADRFSYRGEKGRGGRYDDYRDRRDRGTRYSKGDKLSRRGGGDERGRHRDERSDGGGGRYSGNYRDRSRSPMLDRKRPRVEVSPDSRGSHGVRRDGKDRDGPRSREDSGHRGGSGASRGRSSGSHRIEGVDNASNGARGDVGKRTGGGAMDSKGRDGSGDGNGTRSNSSTRTSTTRKDGSHRGSSSSNSRKTGESGEEEGEVVLSKPGQGNGDKSVDDTVEKSREKSIERSKERSSERQDRISPSPVSDERRNQDEAGASAGEMGDGPSEPRGEASDDIMPPKKPGVDRWANSDSEDDDSDDKGAGAGGAKAKALPGGGDTPSESKANGMAGGDGTRHSDGSAAVSAAEGRADNDVNPKAVDQAAIGDLRRAMGGDKTNASAAGVAKAATSGNSDQNGVDGAAEGGQESSPRPGLDYRTVLTRGEAPQDTYNPLLYGCRSVDNYERVTYIDEGAYGKVYCALNKRTGEVVALKQVKLTHHNGKEGFPITALRETNVLLSLHHPNIVRVLEMVIGSTLDKVYMVMEYFDHDLKSVMRAMKQNKTLFTLGQVKSLVWQLISAVEYMHRHWYIHRDLKTSNLLYNHQGKLAVCDFGMARKYEEPIRAYTFNVVTLWYRSPELLLGQTTYSTGVDNWSVGCIFGELVKGTPMFQGSSEIEQLAKIFGVLGSPTEERWAGWSKLPNPHKVRWRQGTQNTLRDTFPTTGFSGQAFISAQGLELMNGLLALDPSKRISAADAMRHKWFTDEKPEPTAMAEMPQVPSKLDATINAKLKTWSLRKLKEGRR